MKYLIINADDFGHSKVFNEEILKLLRQGKISSTTVMVERIDDTQKKQIEELKKLYEKNNISVGLHFEILGENYNELILSQYNKFIEIMSFPPTHIDIHKQSTEQLNFDIIKFCMDKNIPYRNLGIREDGTKTTFKEYFSGTNNNIENIKKWLSSFEDNKFYEILFHPGRFDVNSKSSLNAEREKDIQKINELNDFIQDSDIRLVTFKEL